MTFERIAPSLAHVVTDIRFTACADSVARGGLLGFVTFKIAGIFAADSIALRLTREGRLSLSFPSRSAPDGRRHDFLRPVDSAARAKIERLVIEQLRELGTCPLATAAEPSP